MIVGGGGEFGPQSGRRQITPDSGRPTSKRLLTCLGCRSSRGHQPADQFVCRDSRFDDVIFRSGCQFLVYEYDDAATAIEERGDPVSDRCHLSDELFCALVFISSLQFHDVRSSPRNCYWPGRLGVESVARPAAVPRRVHRVNETSIIRTWGVRTSVSAF